MALQLKRRGLHRVRPLEGGYAGWTELGYPVVPWETEDPEQQRPIAVAAPQLTA